MSHSDLFKTEWINNVLERYRYQNTDDMYAAIGFGAISPGKIITKLLEEYKKEHQEEIIEEKLQELTNRKTTVKKPPQSGVVVKGIDNCLVKLSKCCNPLPGDEILGYITKGRGVSVHRKDCINVKDLIIENNTIRGVIVENMITKTEPEGEDLKVDIEFDKVGHKRLMAKFAKLEHVFTQQSIFNDEQKIDLSKVKIIGTCFNTYIIVESNGSIYFIDQHAGHERLLYDKFKQSFLNEQLAIQTLLVPYIFDTNHLEMQFINDNIELFNKLGFEIESFGINSFKVSTVPVLLKDISLANFFNSILNDLDNILTFNKADILKEYLEKSACRSAVKANDILSQTEIETLLNMLNAENQILLCPHGRPVIIEVTEKEIEKWFKRIV